MADIPDSRQYDVDDHGEQEFDDTVFAGEVSGPNEEIYLNGRRVTADDPVLELISTIGRASPKTLLGGAALLLGGIALAAFLSNDDNEEG